MEFQVNRSAKQQPPFIRDQIIKRLALTPTERTKIKEFLLSGRLSEIPKLDRIHPHFKLYADWTPEQRTMPSRWLQEDRIPYLTDLRYRKLCITTDAGFGKSVAAQQAFVLRNQLIRGHWSVMVELEELPELYSRYMDDPQTSFLTEHVARKVNRTKNGQNKSSKVHPRSTVHAWILSAIKQGRFSLIVDGLDQEDVETGKSKLKVLRDFLNDFPYVCCILAGRP